MGRDIQREQHPCRCPNGGAAGWAMLWTFRRPLTLVLSVWAQKWCASMLLLGLCSMASAMDQASGVCCHCSNQRSACALTAGSSP